MIYVCKITIQSTCIPYPQFHTYYYYCTVEKNAVLGSGGPTDGGKFFILCIRTEYRVVIIHDVHVVVSPAHTYCVISKTLASLHWKDPSPFILH